jgi:hypothetical protein
MENSEESQESAQEVPLSSKTILAIRDEVEKRVEQRENIYWKFGGLFVAVVIVFGAILWKVSLSEVREAVEKQMAEKEVIKARDKIITIEAEAEKANGLVADIQKSMIANQMNFTNRLSEIKQQDSVLLDDDLSKMFMAEPVTNLVDGKKIVMKFDPIPQTVRVILYPPQTFNSLPMAAIGTTNGFALDGRVLTAKSKELTDGIYRILTNHMYNISVEYVRKSRR